MAVCSEPGCPNLVKRGKCDTHRTQARRASDRRRSSSHHRGYNRQWQRTRRRYLKAHPFCEHDGCPLRATDVDHIDGLGPTGPAGHDWANLRAYCHSHHSQRTARDQAGGWNA